MRSVGNIIQRGGTILGSARCWGVPRPGRARALCCACRDSGVDALVVIGGDGSFYGANLLHNETGLPVLGVPATIDNDIYGSVYTIGFDTAVNTALDAIDRIRDTAQSFERVFFVRSWVDAQATSPLTSPWPAAPTASSSPSALPTSTLLFSTFASVKSRAPWSSFPR